MPASAGSIRDGRVAQRLFVRSATVVPAVGFIPTVRTGTLAAVGSRPAVTSRQSYPPSRSHDPTPDVTPLRSRPGFRLWTACGAAQVGRMLRGSRTDRAARGWHPDCMPPVGSLSTRVLHGCFPGAADRFVWPSPPDPTARGSARNEPHSPSEAGRHPRAAPARQGAGAHGERASSRSQDVPSIRPACPRAGNRRHNPDRRSLRGHW